MANQKKERNIEILLDEALMDLDTKRDSLEELQSEREEAAQAVQEAQDKLTQIDKKILAILQPVEPAREIDATKKRTLLESIREAFAIHDDKPMVLSEIVACVKKYGYKTTASKENFSGMIGAELRESGKFKRISQGVYAPIK
mgnify:CR=1 FL=1